MHAHACQARHTYMQLQITHNATQITRAQGEGLLITNDQLKDHIWAMLRPKHIFKWRERHIANYHIPIAPADAE